MLPISDRVSYSVCLCTTASVIKDALGPIRTSRQNCYCPRQNQRTNFVVTISVVAVDDKTFVSSAEFQEKFWFNKFLFQNFCCRQKHWEATILSFMPKTSAKLFALFKYIHFSDARQNKDPRSKYMNTISFFKSTQRCFAKKHVSDGCSFPCKTTEYRLTTAANSITLLCYGRIYLLTMEVLLMLQMSHRNALRRRRRFSAFFVHFVTLNKQKSAIKSPYTKTASPLGSSIFCRGFFEVWFLSR